MKDISVVIKNLLGGADSKTVRKVGTVVVDAMSRVCGERYVLIPASQLTAEQAKAGVKKPKRWARYIDAVKKDAKPNGYAIVGDWANVWGLSKDPEPRLVMVNVPGYGLIVGETGYRGQFTGAWDSGKEFTIDGLCDFAKFDEGDYEALVAWVKNHGVAEAA